MLSAASLILAASGAAKLFLNRAEEAAGQPLSESQQIKALTGESQRTMTRIVDAAARYSAAAAKIQALNGSGFFAKLTQLGQRYELGKIQNQALPEARGLQAYHSAIGRRLGALTSR